MATPRVFAKVIGADWTNVIGSAASVAGATWQNVGSQELSIAFTTVKPTGTDPYHLLGPKEAFYDKNGSAACWARISGINGESFLSCTTD